MTIQPTQLTPENSSLAERVCQFLDQNKALEIVNIDLAGKTAFADAMIVASGTSGRFVKSLADKLKEFFHKKMWYNTCYPLMIYYLKIY